MKFFKITQLCLLWILVLGIALSVLSIAAQDKRAMVSTEEAAKPKIVLSPNKGENEFYGTEFTQNGRFLISRHVEQYKTTARIWDLKSAVLRQTFWPWADLNAIAVSSDNKTIALGTTDGMMLREFESGAEKATWNFKDDLLVREAMAFSPDGRVLAIALPGVGNDDETSTVRLWSVAKKRVWKSIPIAKHTVDTTSVAFSPDGKLIACGYGLLGDEMDGEVKVWRIADGELLKTLKGHPGMVWRVAFSTDGKSIATASSDKTVRLWNVQADKPLSILQHEAEVQAVAFAADGSIASADGKTIRLWQKDGTALDSWQAHDGFINSVAFNAQGNFLVSASDDGTLKIWDVRTRTLRLTLRVLSTKYSKRGVPTTSWIIYTPDGYYAGSTDCENYIHWRVNDEILPAAKFQKQFCRPDLIAKALKPIN